MGIGLTCAQNEFEKVMDKREVVLKLNELEDLVSEAIHRRETDPDAQPNPYVPLAPSTYPPIPQSHSHPHPHYHPLTHTDLTSSPRKPSSKPTSPAP